MPVLNGPDCLRQLKEINPEVKVLITTGFGDEYTNSHKYNMEESIPVLNKPYTIETLSKVVALKIKDNYSRIV